MELLFWLMVKHFICDFPLQATPWMYKNKGTYGHLGGIAHAAVHAYGTVLVLALLGYPSIFVAMFIDLFAHYHIDWAKMNIGARYNLKPDNSEWFWILLGFDQLLHFFTYFAIAKLAV